MTSRTRTSARRRRRHLFVSLLLCGLAGCGGADGESAGDADRAAAERGGAHADHGGRANRLAGEKSPYLLQHAHNPVDWFPWGEEALARAKSENKPIFLSIGYSTCHWCHVMAHESFEDDSVAAILNERFVPIKVDREERPDLDNLYMSAVHVMGSQGGWPLTVVLTPELEPFFGGTYFPKEDRGQRPGLITILNGIAEMWENDPARAVSAAGEVTNRLRLQAQQMVSSASSSPGRLDPRILDLAFAELDNTYDSAYGGFGSGTKFPTPHKLTFLLRYAARTGNERSLEMARGTLDAMAAGGIHDHLGGGFHRYSTERRWLVPHFEKMLYDQAGLTIAYANAWLVTGDSTYARVARDVADYVLRYLLDPSGGFHSAEDADSEGQEGTFYVWSAAEIDDVLGPERGPAFRHAYGVSEQGNWDGTNIINRVGEPPFPKGFDRERDRLLAVRDKRIRPHLDDKMITSWNGYMIEALALAARVLDEPRYTEAAERAAAFIEASLWRDGRLLRHYRDGAADVLGYLDDYAYLGRGLLALYETTFDSRYLQRAADLCREMERLFSSPDGGYAYTGSDADALLVPIVDLYDGALPSGNSVAALFALRLGHLLADQAMEDRGRRVVATFQEQLKRQPSAYLEMMAGLDFAVGPRTEIVIAGKRSDPSIASMWNAVWDRYLPNAVTAFSPDERDEALLRLVPYLESQRSTGERPSGFVCRDYACRLPVHDAAALTEQLAEN